MTTHTPTPNVMSVQYFSIRKHAGQRLDNYLFRELKSVPRSRVMRMIRKGEVRVNGKRAPVHTKLQEGDRIRVPPVWLDEQPTVKVPTWLRKIVATSVVFEDDRMLILNKPHGVAVHAGGSVQIGVIETAREVFDNEMLELAHRIDQGTSGCLILAKTRIGLLELHHAFQNQRIEKQYDLIVEGVWPPDVLEVSLPLRKISLRSGERRVVVDEAGKSALTRFEIVSQAERHTWLKATPQTGRTHQIRVHCLSQQCPIVGDTKYSTQRQKDQPDLRLMLHASSIKLVDGLVVNVPIEESFTAYWATLIAKD